MPRVVVSFFLHRMSSSSFFGALLPMFLYEMDREFGGFLRFVEARGVTRNKPIPLLLGAASSSPHSLREEFAREVRDRIFLLVVDAGRERRVVHAFRAQRHRHLVEERDPALVRGAWDEFCAGRRTDSGCERDEHVLLRGNDEAYESMRRLVTVPVWSTVASYEAAVKTPSPSVHKDTARRCWGSSVEGRMLLRTCTNAVAGRVELPARVHASELFLHDEWQYRYHGRHPPATPPPPFPPAAMRCGACAISVLSGNCAACAAGEALRRSLVQRPVMPRGWYARVVCAAATHSAKDHLEKSVVVQQLADGRIFRFGEWDAGAAITNGDLPVCRSDRVGGIQDAEEDEEEEEIMDPVCSDVDVVMQCYMRARRGQHLV